MIKQGSSWSIARSALGVSSLAVAALVSVTPVQAHHESNAMPTAVHSVAAEGGEQAQTAKANTGKKVARDTKARGEKKSAHREAHASKSSKKSSDEKNPKVAKVEKSKSSTDDSMGGSDDPLEGL